MEREIDYSLNSFCGTNLVPLLQIRWFLNFDTPKTELYNYTHQNSKVAELISGTVESPLQFLLLMTMYAYQVVPLPWSEDSIIKDSVGNELNVGFLPALISVLLSSLTIVSNTVDLAESKTTKETVSYAGYALTTFIFRMSGYLLALITFREFSAIMFFLIALISLTIIVRFDESAAKGFSRLTTFLVGMFIPCGVSEKPQNSQHREIDPNSEAQAKTRRKLTAKIAMGAIPVIMLFNIILLILLTSTCYRLSTDLPEDSRRIIQTLIIFLVLPSGTFAFIGALCIKGKNNPTLSTALLVGLAILTLSFFGVSIYLVVSGDIYHFVCNKCVASTSFDKFRLALTNFNEKTNR